MVDCVGKLSSNSKDPKQQAVLAKYHQVLADGTSLNCDKPSFDDHILMDMIANYCFKKYNNGQFFPYDDKKVVCKPENRAEGEKCIHRLDYKTDKWEMRYSG